MKISFRQGIVRYQTDINSQPTFLQRSSQDAQFVDLVVSPDPTIITFAHRAADYVFEEAKTVRNAWGPFPSGQTAYLYWDINVLTAALTRGFTNLPPIYSGVAPSNPASGQHWFDSINTVMFVWNGDRWIEKIRVFAAVYSSAAIIKPSSLGTQAGLNTTRDAGNIVLDGFFKPLRQSNGSFLTSTTGMSVVGIATKKIKIEGEILTLLADEYIPMFSCIQTRRGRTAILGRSTDRMSRVAGIATEDVHRGETSIIVGAGLLRNENWNWPEASINRPVFCGPTGQITLTPPTTGVLQQVGSVYDTDAVYVRIFPSITLDHPDGILLPPLPNPLTYPVADFSALPLTLSGAAPLTVNFVSAATNGPFLSHEWDFTNDGTADATTANATYTYAVAGTYNVRYKVTNAFGTDTETKNGWITVTAAPAQIGFTNLDIRFVVNNQEDDVPVRVQRGAEFDVKLRVSNAGNLGATNVQRVFIAYDVQGQQVTVITPPAGAQVSRGVGFTQIIFAPIATLASGDAIDYPPFVLRAPSIIRPFVLEAAVSSPQIDSTTSDNTRSLTIEVTA